MGTTTSKSVKDGYLPLPQDEITVVPTGPHGFDSFLLPVQVGKPKGDMVQNTLDLLCADGRYTEEECRQLATTNGSVEFRRLADQFARSDTQDQLLRSIGL